MQITINDVNLYYEKHGNGKKNILILPGWGNTRRTFNYMINFLKEYATVYILDYPGFGNSNFPNRDLTVYDYGYLIKDFIKVNAIENPIIICHSFGSRILFVLIGFLNFSPHKILIMNGAGIKSLKSLSTYLKIIIYKILKLFKIFIRKEKKKVYLNKLSNIFGSKDYNNLNSNMRRTFVNIINEDLALFLKNIKQETLILWGDTDFDTPLKCGKKMKKLIADSELIVFKKTGHYCYLENPVLVNKIIYEYIKNDI